MWLDIGETSTERDLYAMALGKALVLAQNFEGNCKFVATIHGLASGLKSGELTVFGDEMWSLVVDQIRRSPLIANISSLPTRENEMEVLQTGREARNRLVHEAGQAIRSSIGRYIQDIENLRLDVSRVAEADNIVSAWSFEIQEKQRAPDWILKRYVEKCVTWVFAGIPLPGDGQDDVT